MTYMDGATPLGTGAISAGVSTFSINTLAVGTHNLSATKPPAEAGELTRITDESGQSSYSHDALGRLTTKTVIIGSKTFTISYSWGDSGAALDKLTSITYPSGSRVNYGYDARGFVNAISINAVNASGSGPGGTTQALLTGISYNADNNVTGWLWSDGKDAHHRLRQRGPDLHLHRVHDQ